MTKRILVLAIVLLAIFGLMVSCKNEVTNAGFGEELVSVSFKEDMARGLTATLEGFDKDHLYWAYAAEKADGSNLISGETDSYDESGAVWVKTDGYNKPVEGLGTTGTSGYEAYKVSGFSQGYWNFKLYAYKGVLGDNPATTEIEEDDFITGYVLVYQGETLNALLKSDSANTQGSHLVSVIVDPIQSQDNGTMVFLTNKSHLPADRISMNTVNSATYGTNYTVKVLSILSIEEIPNEYVGTAAEERTATDGQDGLYNLPAGSYKVTVAFTDSASAPTVNYAKGTIVATVYSNLTTTISGDLTEAMTYAEFDGDLNPDLETVTASNDQPIVKEDDPTKTVVLTTNTSAAKEVTATIKAGDTNKIINNMADTAGTNTDAYNQNLNLTLSVETVETTATTATYEIGMTAELKSIKISDQSTTTTTRDVSEVDEYVRVEVQLETGLTAVNVLHDGLQMVQGLENPDPNNVGKFAYNAVSGVLTIETKSFSPFSVSFTKPDVTTYVAQVGNVKYQSLAAAITVAKEDGTDTITLLNDVSLESATDINKKVVLDLAGYKITATAGLTASVAETTIKNGSIVGALTVSGSNIGLSAVTVTGSVDVSGSVAFDSDCSVTGTAGVAYAINVTGSIVIEGGTYAAAEGEDKYILRGNATISDGNFKGELAPSNAENIVLTGGTYSEIQVDSRLAQGYECVEISAGVFKVRSTVEAVNVNTGVEYHFFKNAIDAASSGDTVKLLKNITVESEIAIAAGKTLSIDLNGKVITGTEHAKSKAVFRNAGNLTIIGTTAGSAINADATAVASIEGSTLTVNGGSYSNSYLVDNAGAYVFDVNGTATINGVTLTGIVKGIRAEGSGASVTVSDSSADVTPGNGSGWGLFGSANEGELIISSGTYRTTYSAQRQMFDIKEDGHITVNGGSFETVYSKTGDAPALVVFNGGGSVQDSLTITGGVFKYAGKFGYINGSLHEVVSISGGTFDASSVVVDNGGTGNVLEYSISGGKYKVDPTVHLALGCFAELGTDEYFTVAYDNELMEAAAAKGLTVVRTGIENFNPSYSSVSKLGCRYADGSFTGDNTVYRFYKDGKLYICDASEVEGTTYSFRSDVDGIRGWSNSTITEITINSPLEQAEKQFQGNTAITTVNFSSAATRIPARMFYMANGLVSVSLPDTVTVIEGGAFQQCANLTSLSLPSGLAAIPGNLVYESVNLSAMGIPETVTSIGENAIRNVDLVTITIPAGVRSIGSQAFRDCESVSEIHVYIDSTDGLTIAQNAFSNVAGPYPTTYMYIYDHDVFKYIEGLHLSSADHITLVDVNAPVAIIGEVAYSSLQAALDAVEDGQTVVLCKDIEIESGLVFDKSGVTATLDLGGNKVEAKSFDKNSQGINKLLSIQSGSLSVKNGTLKNINAEQDITIYGIVLGANVSVSAITDVDLTVSGTGIYLSSGATLNTLNSNIHTYIDTDGSCLRHSIYLADGSRIGEISGGEYLSEMTEAYFDSHRSSKSVDSAYCFQVEKNASIDLISGGVFKSTMPSTNYANYLWGEIKEISGGYFGFTVWNWGGTCRLIEPWTNVKTISGGTFESGGANAVFDLSTGGQTSAFRTAAAIGSTNELQFVGTVTTWYATSKSDWSYTANVYSVVPIN